MARPHARALPSSVRILEWDGRDLLPVMRAKAQSMLADFRGLNPTDFYKPRLRGRPGPQTGEHELRDRTMVYEIVRVERALVALGWKKSEAAAAARRDVVGKFGVSDDTASLALKQHRGEAEENQEAYAHSLGQG